MCLFRVYRLAMLSYEFVLSLSLGNVVVWICLGFTVWQCCRMGLFWVYHWACCRMGLFWVYRWAMLSYGFDSGLPLGNVVVWV